MIDLAKLKCDVCGCLNGSGRGRFLRYGNCGHHVCAECLDGQTGVLPIPPCQRCLFLYPDGQWIEEVYQW